jgi:hypothetical protein
MSDVVADVSMQTKRAWLTQVLGISWEDGGDTQGGHLEAGDVRDRLNELGLKLRELGALPEGAGLKKDFAEAVAALKAGRLEDAWAILDEIEPTLIELLPMARGKEAARVVGSAKAWRAAIAHITETLNGFKASVISMLEANEHEPEEIDEASELIDQDIEDITENLSEELADQVDAVINGDPSRREAAMKTIMTQVQAVEDKIVGHEGVDAIEDNGVIPISIREPVKAALNQLRDALKEAAGEAEKAAA